MKPARFGTIAALFILFRLIPFACAQAEQPANDAVVTLKGVMMFEVSCTRDLRGEAAKTAEKTPVLFAVEGTPEVQNIVDQIIKANWPGESINADQAVKIQEEFEKQLKYYITPGDLTAKKENQPRWRNPAVAITGTLSEKDGKKFITPTSIALTPLKYPDKMNLPDKPLAQPGKVPLVLKISDTLTLNCILLPAGKFFAGVPFYSTYEYDGSQMRYDDDFPYLITLTKPFYMAEIPVTQEMYQSVMGNNPSDQKGPQIPVMRAHAADIEKFCQILSEKSGRTVRLPTQAEWEYAGRVGTSNPSTVNAKYIDQVNLAPDGKSLLPVKSKKPNAWGLYDMISGSWEMIGDHRQVSRADTIDPFYPDKKDNEHNALGRNAFDWVITREGVGDGGGTGYTLTTFRIAVEATPQEIDEMQKAQKQ